MRTVVISHRAIAAELGHLDPWLESVSTIDRAYREDGLHAGLLQGADLLVVLGSPGSVASEHCLPPAKAEIDLVSTWVQSGRPYLGICFGAQVLACALGGSVRRMPSTYRALGILPLSDGAPEALAGPWLTWHEDAIAAPAGAQPWARLAHADLAFAQGRAWGLQPHVEVTAASLARMLGALAVPDDTSGPFVEGMAQLEASTDPPSARVARLLEDFACTALGGHAPA